MNKITYSDVEQYSHLFSLVPSFVINSMAKRNSNLVAKFDSTIKSYLDNLTHDEKIKLDLILSSDVDYLQSVMQEAYEKRNKKQYKVLANPDYRNFIILNLDELKKIIKKDI